MDYPHFTMQLETYINDSSDLFEVYMDFYKAFVNIVSPKELVQFIGECDQMKMPDMGIGVLQTFLKKTPNQGIPISVRSIVHNALGHFYCQINKFDIGLYHFLDSLALDKNPTAEFNLYQRIHMVGSAKEWQTFVTRMMPIFSQLQNPDRIIFRMVDSMSHHMLAKDCRLCLQFMQCRPLAELMQTTLATSYAFQTKNDVDGWVQQVEHSLDLALEPSNLKRIAAFFEANKELSLPVLGYYLIYTGLNTRSISEKIRMLNERIHPFLSYRASHTQRVQISHQLNRRIKVGVISRHIHSANHPNHPVSKVLAGAFHHLDPKDFEVTFFTFDKPTDEPYESSPHRKIVELGKKGNHFVDMIVYWQQVISKHELDVIIYPDIGMEKNTYYLSMARLAPVQVATWGHPQSHCTAIDYFISSTLFQNNPDMHGTNEKLICMEGCSFYYQNMDDTILQSYLPRAYFHLPEDVNVYMCVQTVYKITPMFDEIIQGILDRDKKAVVMILNNSHPGNNTAKDAIRERLLAACGMDAMRVQFLDRMLVPSEFCACCRLADCLIDTFPFSGGITSLECLSMDLPIVTLDYPTICGSQTSSYYRLMGMTDLITTTAQEYVTTAVRLANDRTWRQELCDKIACNKHVLYENKKAVRLWNDTLQHIVKKG